MNDYYRILGIKKNASQEDIRKAYKQGALFWHPDKNKSPIAHDKFIQIYEAYNILIDGQKRIVYDLLYDVHFKKNIDLTTYQETKANFNVYNNWINEARVKANKLAIVSIDNVLTNTFHFIDKYGWFILLIFSALLIVFCLILKEYY